MPQIRFIVDVVNNINAFLCLLYFQFHSRYWYLFSAVVLDVKANFSALPFPCHLTTAVLKQAPNTFSAASPCSFDLTLVVTLVLLLLSHARSGAA